MRKKTRHVVPSQQGGWAVRTSGSTRATRVFETQKEAERFARNLARKESGELYVHKRDGTISKRDSYGKDPGPPRGRR